MLWLRIIAAVSFLAIFAYIAVSNWLIVIKSLVTKQDQESWVPIVGGFSGVVGLFLLPVNMPESVRLLPMILDWGSLPGHIHSAIWHVWFKPKENETQQQDKEKAS